ncbi:hypothetical protein ACFQ36_11175 [Arthrobacter sp. GCM10027362]|uniref:hypothetical protein n=1 Tax=Arthrobacter sp. GCM10027362 TaxID=3273379 RepID=UPI00363DBEAE
MSLDIAAVILVLAAAVVPVALTLLTKLRARHRRRMKTASSAGTAHAPRHFATGSRPAGQDTWWLPALGNFASDEEPVRTS